MKHLSWLAVLAVVISSDKNGLSQENSGDVTLQVMKYDGLKDSILRNRGKVILVDFWGEF